MYCYLVFLCASVVYFELNLRDSCSNVVFIVLCVVCSGEKDHPLPDLREYFSEHQQLRCVLLEITILNSRKVGEMTFF